MFSYCVRGPSLSQTGWRIRNPFVFSLISRLERFLSSIRGPRESQTLATDQSNVAKSVFYFIEPHVFRFANAKCLLQGPETSKVPKVVRRGCKRCSGPREQRSPKSLLHHQNPVLHRCNSLLHQCKRSLAPLVQKTFCTLS